jgi:hypothetical protein
VAPSRQHERPIDNVLTSHSTNTQCSPHILTPNSYTVLCESIALGITLQNTWISKKYTNIQQKMQLQNVILETHKHIHSMIKVCLFQQTVSHIKNPQDDSGNEYYELILSQCAQHSINIWHNLTHIYQAVKEREVLIQLLYSLETIITQKLLPYCTSHLAQFFQQFKKPKHNAKTNIFQSLLSARSTVDPYQLSLQTNYYYPISQDFEEARMSDQPPEETNDIDEFTQNTIHPTEASQIEIPKQTVSDFIKTGFDGDTMNQDDNETVINPQEIQQQHSIREYRMRFTIFRKPGWAPSSLSQLAIFKDFLRQLKNADANVQILPIDNELVKPITSDKMIEKIDASSLPHFFKAQNTKDNTITGEFHIIANKPYKELFEHDDLKRWFQYHRYGRKFSEHQVSPMIKIGFLTRVRSITYRDGLRNYIMNHPSWTTHNKTPFFFTFHFKVQKIT